MQRVSRHKLQPTVPMLRWVGPAMMVGGWSRKLGERTDAPTSSRSASASTKRSSATALMSISTGGANDAAADIDHEIGAGRRAAGYRDIRAGRKRLRESSMGVRQPI